MPKFDPPAEPAAEEPVTIYVGVQQLAVSRATVHRWLNDGFIVGETPSGYLPMREAMQWLGVTRQTVLNRVERGEVEAVHVSRGRRKGLRITVLDDPPDLFDNNS